MNPFRKHATTFLAGAALAVLAFGPQAARAQSVTFDSPQTLKDNFRVLSGAAALVVEQVGDASVLTFTQDKPVTATAVYSPEGKAVGGTDQTIIADFQLQEGTSFGLLVRATADDKDSYMVLVNAFPKKGGMLRAFRTPMWPQRDPTKDVIANKNVPISPDTWYQLRVLTKNSGENAVDIDAGVYAIDKSGKAAAKPIVELKTTQKENPLTKPGQIGLRLFSGSNNGKVAVRSLSISPETAPIEK